MCRRLFCLMSLVVVVSIAADASGDLILHWNFDDGSGTTVHDSSGNGYDGTLEGNATWVAGKIGGALDLGGGGDRVVDETAGDYINGLDAITICLWIKSDVVGTDKGFVIFEDPAGGDNRNIRYDASSWAWEGGSNLIKMALDSTGGHQAYEGSDNTQTTEWQHVAMVWSSGNELLLYIDGELDTPRGNDAGTTGTITGVTKLIVGQGCKDDGGGWDGLIDDVRIYNEALSAANVKAAMKGEEYPYAMGPVPADGAIIEDTWVTLNWSPGDFTVSHDVYLGDNIDDVSEGLGETFRANQATTMFIAGFPGFAYPDGLVPGTTYYWRIDEVNEAEPNSPWKGPVWSFSVPPKTAYTPDPADGAESVELNAVLGWTPGFSAKVHTVYFGDDFDTVSSAAGGTPQGTATYDPGPLKLARTYYWRVDEFDAVDTYKGDVWSFTTQGAVGSPNPANGAVGVEPTAILGWNAGALAASHEVYFGMDADVVKNAAKTAPEYKGTRALGDESYDPDKLALETAYYWRIDEVNSTSADSPWLGNVWSFTTGDFFVVEDFEDYTDDDSADEAIWQAWIDGFGVTDNGSQVGYVLPPYAEQTIVHGGSQSMPVSYDNTSGATNSEATLALTAQRNWTEEGVGELSIWLQGQPASVGSFTEDPVGTYAITATGGDIWNDADEFHYAFKTLTGVGSIEAQVLSVENTNNWAKAGVMIRETLDPGSKFAAVYITPTNTDGTPTNGCRFQARTDTDADATSDSSLATDEQQAVTTPFWVKLERDIAGNFRGYYSSNGTAWTPMAWNPQSISMTSNVYVGLALTSHNNNAVGEARFSNVRTTGTVGPQWANQDIGIASNAAEPLYVAVSNAAGAPAVVVHDDPAAANIETWTEWVIPLQTIADQGINLTDVDKIAVGLGSKSGMTTTGGSGRMFFDDIRLYRSRDAAGQ
ncbi:MAG: LamG domain-containing protein [Planctomycetota bacterium]